MRQRLLQKRYRKERGAINMTKSDKIVDIPPLAVPGSSQRTDVVCRTLNLSSRSTQVSSRPGAFHIRGPGDVLGSHSSRTTVSTEERPVSLPGAVHVRGIDEISESTNDETSGNFITTISETEEEESLPVAFPINHDRQDESPDPDFSTHAYTDDSSIIDGVLINKGRRLKSSDVLILMATTIPIILALSLTFSMTKPREPQQSSPIMTPIPDETHPPSISIPPTSSMVPTSLELDYVKSLVRHISDEDVLNDPRSIQYFVVRETAKNLPRLIEREILKRDDSKKIIERYVFGVVLLSRIEDFDFFRKSVEDAEVGKLCDIYQCNEKEEISLFEVKNQWSTGLGKGIIADEIGFLPGLEHIIMTGNALVGTIPSSIGMLKNLKTLDLKDNLLTGRIPSELGRLQNLEYVYLHSNKISGAVPSEVGNIANLVCMDLSENSLQGTLSSELHNLRSLKGLSLQSSGLSGDVNFLCDKGLARGNFSIDVDIGNTKTHQMICNQGLIVDCFQSKLSCDCCWCK